MSNNDALPDDQQEDLGDIGGDLKNHSAVVYSADWTVQTILQQIRKGNIELNPDFQRREAWRQKRKSLYIESLILNIPVPQIVLAERRDKRGQFIVIDGKQRLLTLRQFTSTGDDPEFKSFKLFDLSIRKDLNGANYETLSNDIIFSGDVDALENSTIRTAVIRGWKNEDFLYSVFLRLNTGSVQLSPQELRQALHRGKFTNFVDKYSSESPHLKKILHLEKADVRMRDAELLIRYYAFHNFLDTYTGNLKPLLDKTAEIFNAEWDVRSESIFAQRDAFEQAIQTSLDVFGEKGACRKWNGTRFEPALNRAVFDVMLLYFVRTDIAKRAVKAKTKVLNEFKKLCTDNERFKSSIEGTTKSIDSIYVRLRLWGETLQGALDVQMKLPQLVNNKIII